ncbi:MAG: hypothetical protein FRX49_09758 [Trebouxia sp. A1-2]|nr:MAG: hypothetical protein FRX49_09758 [Trebouxia sp. A1-2]
MPLNVGLVGQALSKAGLLQLAHCHACKPADCDPVYLKSVRQSGTTMTSGFGDRSGAEGIEGGMVTDLTPDCLVANECDDHHRHLEGTGCTCCNVMQSSSWWLLKDVESFQSFLPGNLVAGQGRRAVLPISHNSPIALQPRLTGSQHGCTMWNHALEGLLLCCPAERLCRREQCSWSAFDVCQSRFEEQLPAEQQLQNEPQSCLENLGAVSEPCRASRNGVALGVSGPGAREEVRRDLMSTGTSAPLKADLSADRLEKVKC